jgi:hypothetical protein
MTVLGMTPSPAFNTIGCYCEAGVRKHLIVWPYGQQGNRDQPRRLAGSIVPMRKHPNRLTLWDRVSFRYYKFKDRVLLGLRDLLR